jgi:hypothetical protein
MTNPEPQSDDEATDEVPETNPEPQIDDEATHEAPETNPEPQIDDEATHEVPETNPEPQIDDEATHEVPETNPEPQIDDEATHEVPETIRAAAAELQASLSDPDRPKTDHFGTFDPIYRLLGAVRWSRIGKKIPGVIMKPIRYLMHVIVIHDDYKRMLTGENPFADPFILSRTEHVVPLFS